MENITRSIASIESEAEEILESARKKAKELLAEAREKAKKITSSQLDMNEVKAECVTIVHKAKEEAEKRIEISHQESAKVESHANQKINEVVTRILKIVTGVEW